MNNHTRMAIETLKGVVASISTTGTFDRKPVRDTLLQLDIEIDRRIVHNEDCENLPQLREDIMWLLTEVEMAS